jgi:hypothetical protein
MWKIDPNKTQALSYISNIFPKVGLLEETKEEEKKKKMIKSE